MVRSSVAAIAHFRVNTAWPGGMCITPHDPLESCARSPYIFVLAVNTTAYDDGVIGSPATVFAVLKATSELVHRFVVDRGAGGVAVVP